jgi:high-affinity iron transporter
VLDPTSWYGAAISGMFNITGAPTVLETIAYLVYLVPVLAVFLWPSRRPAAPSRTVAVAGTSPNAASPETENPQHVPA